MSHLALASRCSLDADRPGALDLLGLQGGALKKFAAACTEAALMDLQEAMELAWESGEVGESGTQCVLPLMAA